MDNVRVHIHPAGDKTAQLRCNWCGLVHQVEPAYREKILKHGIEVVAEFKKEAGIDVKPEDTWTCGRCFLYLHGLPVDTLRTDCPEHDVPKERKEPQL